MSINAPEQYLTKTFPPFVKVKFIRGVLGHPAIGKKFGGEAEMYTYGVPLSLKAYGFPIHVTMGGIHIDPVPLGTIGFEWNVNLPKYVREGLVQKFGDIFAFGYDGEFSLHSMKEGLEKDGITSIDQCYRFSKSLYLWKKG